jgi:hypothetical protein
MRPNTVYCLVCLQGAGPASPTSPSLLIPLGYVKHPPCIVVVASVTPGVVALGPYLAFMMLL